MPLLPAIAGAAKFAAPYVATKLPKYLKKFYNSKHFLTTLLGGGYLVGKGTEAFGQAGERGLSREQIELQKLIQQASMGATKMSIKESRANTKKYMDMLIKAKAVEAREARDIESMRSFTQSQDRQMALVLQAVQAIGQRQPGAGGGMLGTMRRGF